jgi:hypothetical protein
MTIVMMPSEFVTMAEAIGKLAGARSAPDTRTAA